MHSLAIETTLHLNYLQSITVNLWNREEAIKSNQTASESGVEQSEGKKVFCFVSPKNRFNFPPTKLQVCFHYLIKSRRHKTFFNKTLNSTKAISKYL